MKWGFAGFGRIAQTFFTNLEAAEDEEIVAIASQSKYKNVPNGIRGYQSYEELYADPEIDIVYVNTTHNTHKQISIAALNAGKHVLCEKPMGISRAEVDEMIQAAKHNGKFLMEAIWSRYLPAYIKVKELIQIGIIGDVELIQANFGFRMNPDAPKLRLTEKNLAGGAVWDVGIYPIMFALDIFNQTPLDIQASGMLNSNHVETRAVINMAFGGGKFAQLSCGFDWSTKNHAIIQGTKGRIIMEDFWKCEHFQVQGEDGIKDYHLPVTSTGMYHEAIACAELVAQGKIESDVISWQDSRLIASTLDEVIGILRS